MLTIYNWQQGRKEGDVLKSTLNNSLLHKEEDPVLLVKKEIDIGGSFEHHFIYFTVFINSFYVPIGC